ncbi:DUF488 domain-containing protein [Paracoccus halophilus]|uniref:DUF488 domain-containing protein n=1 Tax=Paracoccus halophilus TaxID=376733 RepID=UPI000942A0CE|nr:DUF488 domain-containing protein [Paracoccus halophilus]
MNQLFTIGVYGWNKQSFLDKIISNKIDLIVDIRMRRGVRGKSYTFANSKELQKTLSGFGVSYVHIKELAPTKEIRAIQSDSDTEGSVAKKDRERLSDGFVEKYMSDILSEFNYDGISKILESHHSPCLLCVEGPAMACHRSIVSQWIYKNSMVPVYNIEK